jgi:hypothetical protein
MRNRTAMVVCILIGSVFVHCTQTMVTSMDGLFDGGTFDLRKGATKDAQADSASCVACDREAATVIFDDVLEPTQIGAGNTCSLATPVFDLTAYRSVVVHAKKCGALVQVRNGKAGFVSAIRDACITGDSEVPHPIFVNPLAGREMRVNFGGTSAGNADGYVGCASESVAVTIVGYKNL